MSSTFKIILEVPFFVVVMGGGGFGGVWFRITSSESNVMPVIFKRKKNDGVPIWKSSLA